MKNKERECCNNTPLIFVIDDTTFQPEYKYYTIFVEFSQIPKFISNVVKNVGDDYTKWRNFDTISYHTPGNITNIYFVDNLIECYRFSVISYKCIIKNNYIKTVSFSNIIYFGFKNLKENNPHDRIILWKHYNSIG